MLSQALASLYLMVLVPAVYRAWRYGASRPLPWWVGRVYVAAAVASWPALAWYVLKPSLFSFLVCAAAFAVSILSIVALMAAQGRDDDEDEEPSDPPPDPPVDDEPFDWESFERQFWADVSRRRDPVPA